MQQKIVVAIIAERQPSIVWFVAKDINDLEFEMVEALNKLQPDQAVIGSDDSCEFICFNGNISDFPKYSQQFVDYLVGLGATDRDWPTIFKQVEVIGESELLNI